MKVPSWSKKQQVSYQDWDHGLCKVLKPLGPCTWILIQVKVLFGYLYIFKKQLLRTNNAIYVTISLALE